MDLLQYFESVGQPVPGSLYSDDWAAFITRSSVPAARVQISAIAERRAGRGAINEGKNVEGRCVEILGVLFDLDTLCVAISAATLLKLLALFFVEVPLEAAVGDTLSLRTFQRLAAYAIRVADVVQVLGFYSTGFSANLQGLHPLQTFVRLQPLAYHDLGVWRDVLKAALHDARVLLRPMVSLVRFAFRPDESSVDRAARLASSASVVIFVDACTGDDQWRNGMGGAVYIKGEYMGYFSFEMPTWQTYVTDTGDIVATDINLLESGGMVHGVAIYVHHLMPRLAPVFDQPVQVHVWSDNSSALAWLSSRRIKSPMHGFLFRTLSRLLTEAHIELSAGHIPGVSNVLADAASRGFRGAGPSSHRAYMESQACIPPLPDLLSGILRQSAMPSVEPYPFPPR
jgi:hypothetical protein